MKKIVRDSSQMLFFNLPTVNILDAVWLDRWLVYQMLMIDLVWDESWKLSPKRKNVQSNWSLFDKLFSKTNAVFSIDFSRYLLSIISIWTMVPWTKTHILNRKINVVWSKENLSTVSWSKKKNKKKESTFHVISHNSNNTQNKKRCVCVC